MLQVVLLLPTSLTNLRRYMLHVVLLLAFDLPGAPALVVDGIEVFGG